MRKSKIRVLIIKKRGLEGMRHEDNSPNKSMKMITIAYNALFDSQSREEHNHLD